MDLGEPSSSLLEALSEVFEVEFVCVCVFVHPIGTGVYVCKHTRRLRKGSHQDSEGWRKSRAKLHNAIVTTEPSPLCDAVIFGGLLLLL